jgi:hypothetical protein
MTAVLVGNVTAADCVQKASKRPVFRTQRVIFDLFQ